MNYKVLREISIKNDTVKVEIYGGFDEIGGNCIVVRDHDRKIVFDNGIRFSVMKKFYGGRVEPLGPSELRSIRAIPPLEVFSNVSAVYISHYHLDHVGLLNAIPPEVVIKVPSVELLNMTLAEWYKFSSKWYAYIVPDDFANIEDVRMYELDNENVIAMPVSHSSYPACAFLYFGKEITVFYSGDLRVEPLVNLYELSFEDILRKEGVDHIDIALIEGTNFSCDIMPLSSADFRNILLSIFENYELIIVSVDPLDFETFMIINRLASLTNREIVISSERVLWMTDVLYKYNSHYLSSIYVDEDLKKPTCLKTISLAEAISNSGKFIIIAEPIGLLETLRRLRMWKEINLVGSAAILTDPEPRETIKEVEERVLKKWLKMLGLQVIRVRFSGHYYPHQFKDLIKILKPRKIIPIHTKATQLMMRLFEKYKHRYT